MKDLTPIARLTGRRPADLPSHANRQKDILNHVNITHMKRLEVRVAKSSPELDGIFALRYRVYVEEQHKFGYAQCGSEGEIWDELDDDCAEQLYISDDSGAVIACMRLNWGQDTRLPDYLCNGYQMEILRGIPPRKNLYVSRLVIAAEARGSAAILDLPMMAYRLARQRGVQLAFLNSACSLVRIYEKLGFRRIEGQVDDPFVGARQPMLLVIEDAEHLKRVRSPLSGMAPINPSPFVTAFHEEFGHVFSGGERTLAAA